MTDFTTEDTFQGYRAALAFFIAVEHDPMDDAHNDIADALVQEFGPDEILRGLALVAAVLRDSLRGHTNDCDCGSDEWLERKRLESLEDTPDA